MDSLLQELNEIIRNASQRDWVDYVAIFVPLGATIISLVISILALLNSNKIGKQQNNIALFDKRYRALNVLGHLLSTTQILLQRDISDTKITLYGAMETYRSSTTLTDTIPKGDDVLSFYTGLVFEAGKVEHLFQDTDIKPVMDFLAAFYELVANTYTKKEFEAEVKSLKRSYMELQKTGTMNALEKITTL